MSIAANIATLRSRISHLDSVRANEGRSSPRVIAVCKTRSAEEVRDAANAGLRDFGENYVQEALPKIRATRGLNLEWHFIGRVQSNKARDIARNFQWIHTVDRAKVAQRLNENCSGEALNVCIQIDLEEALRYGVKGGDLVSLIQEVDGLEHLRLRGLMCMPAPDKDADELCRVFRQARQTFDECASLVASSTDWDTLSMGMSGDFERALEQGATCLRIGTGIFGPRNARYNAG